MSSLMPTHLKVTVTNVAPLEGGPLITSLWIGAHDGSFDTFNFDEPASTGVEAVAEDGVTGLEGTIPGLVDELIGLGLDPSTVPPQADTIAGIFTDSDAAQNGGSQSHAQSAPVGFFPGQSSSTLIELSDDPSQQNRYFSYLSMFIPSNDAFIGNEDPLAIDLFDDEGNFVGADFVVSGTEVWDAGTEVNDEDFTTIPFTLDLVGNGIPENGVVQPHPGLRPLGDGGALDFMAPDGALVFQNSDFTAPGYELIQVSIEAISAGTPFENSIFGDSVDDTLDGTEEADLIDGGAGDDLVSGNLGSDTLLGGDGDDVLRGGSNSRDSQVGVTGDDTIFGGAGNDRIGGKGGNDTLFGDDGDDQIWGDDGDDLLRGGLGNDTLTGDDFSGGQGADTFVLVEGEGTDTIVDFEIGIDLIGLADGLTFGDLVLSGNSISVGTEELAILTGVSTETLSETDFRIV